MNLVFATHNLHKIEEARAIAGATFCVHSLTDIGSFEEIPETSDSFMGNALQKAQFVYEKYGCDCFADDTGLEVAALNGQPGVYSARYAGEKASYHDNVVKLLHDLGDEPNRKARFRTIIALILNGEIFYFEGEICGEITKTPYGNGGFGYDPIFVPEGCDKTFAELGDAAKNKISHRAIAIEKMTTFLLERERKRAGV